MKFLYLVIIFLLSGLNSHSQGSFEEIWISDDLKLLKLSEDVFVHVSYHHLPGTGRFPSNGMVYINGCEALLFDTPMTDSLTRALTVWLEDSMHLQLTGFIPNHWHDDCMGGLGYLKSHKVRSWTNQMTIDIAKTKNLPLPDIGFEDSLLLKFGDKTVECYYPGVAHSLDNIVVWLPEEKILFAGCMVKSINSNNLGNTADGDLKAYPETIGRVMKRYPDAKFIIPGHGEPGGFELLEHTLKLSNN
ncbi:MAG: subclass B1 metallo-beta-lactamase [Bacteroidales bacterium]|nr:subclass B1 metallo-beta-lactamase [Bacteroidales bacterium]